MQDSRLCKYPCCATPCHEGLYSKTRPSRDSIDLNELHAGIRGNLYEPGAVLQARIGMDGHLSFNCETGFGLPAKPQLLMKVASLSD